MMLNLEDSKRVFGALSLPMEETLHPVECWVIAVATSSLETKAESRTPAQGSLGEFLWLRHTRGASDLFKETPALRSKRSKRVSCL